ncbi:subtilisin-like protein [Hyaloscypha variabilis F]|uniref:Subtilisin-like protein n=1 Tax=Hyaloscypha variabilis (strain UAMH 11265 / GT02V1 / F) TaxID=1149755 RepID=A0A2J6SAV8_HYAVF|nr:subtilisin-like protein [Hyaloscypha variabilis F]
MDDDTDSQSLLQSVLGLFARKRPQRSAKPASLTSRKREAWLRTDAFLQRDDLGEADPESVARTLRAFEHLVQDDSDREIDFSYQQTGHERYPKLRRIIENPNRDPHADPGAVIRVSKRRRECDDAIEELLHLDQERKKRRVLPREEPTHGSNLEDPNADFAVLMRRHLVSLDNALRRHWVCVCQKCSGLSVRLSLPQHKKDLEAEASFEVFFGVRSVPATALQEAKITVKDLHNSPLRRSSEPIISNPSDFAHICQSITESLGQRNCLHFALEDGIFQRLRPQPKTFGSDRMSRTVSLSALFNRQQELLRGESVLPLKGKRVLAVTLASALLPFLETPWLQFSFNHSMIQFFEPRQDGELPDITKPFLALEHVPTISARSKDTGDSSGASKHMVHPNASVLALGILLCELHYCTPVELMAKDPHVARNVNDDLYTCLDKLQTLEDDAGVDYYLATKACLTGEYYPLGQHADFEDVSVQRLFYQNVVKRLEAVIFKAWGIRLENLGSFDSRQNESCWGSIGREVVRLHTGKVDPSNANNAARASPHRSMSDNAPASYASLHSDVVLRMSAQTSSGSQAHGHLAEPSEKSMYIFDASHQSAPEQENPLSERWMDNLLSSIHPYVDPAFDLAEPVRIAILDSGLDPENPFLIEDQQQANPRIKEARSFVHGTGPHDIRDEIGHGTHALGLLLKVAPCAEIYVARIARRETLDPNTYDDIAKARLSLYQNKLFVKEWKVDIISMSFAIREYHELMSTAISNALNKRTLLFAAASNDGANLGRAFPAQYPSVFCIHSTDGNGNPSNFNPTASETDVNFSLLGEHVSSHWPAGMNGHNQTVNVMSGTSVATPIAAGLAASVLSFVRQQDQHIAVESERLGPWLKRDNSMDAVFKSMVRQRRGVGYDYITPHVLFDSGSTREEVYGKIKDIKRNMYKY